MGVLEREERDDVLVEDTCEVSLLWESESSTFEAGVEARLGVSLRLYSILTSGSFNVISIANDSLGLTEGSSSSVSSALDDSSFA